MSLAVVQAKEIRSGTSGSLTVTSALTVTGGNLMVTGSSIWTESTADSVSDSVNGTYTRLGQCTSASSFTGALHYAKNITGGSLNLTVTGGTGAAACQAFFHEVSGADTAAPFTAGEFAATNSMTATTNPVTPAVTNSVANSIFFAYLQDMANGGAETMTVNSTGSTPTGWALESTTQSQETDANNFIPASMPFLVVSSGASTKHGWTVTTSGSHGACIAAFKAATGGGTTPSSSDSATLTDTANKIGVNGPSDSGSETEANKIGTGSSDSATLAEQNAIALLQSDSASFAQQVAITAATSTSDTASLTESIKIALGATDSAQLGEAMALALAHQDTATLQELVSVALAIADAASLSESASVTQNGGNTPSSSDSGALTDTTASTAAVSTSDIGALAEQAAIALKVTDVAAMTEQIGLGLIAADSAALNQQLAIAVANAATDSAALAEVQTAVNAALAAAQAVTLGESATVQVFSGGARDWVYVISAPTAKWIVNAPLTKWNAHTPLLKWSAGAPQQ